MDVSIVEIFETIQGEGVFAGVPTVLVRFSGCNLNCVYCDTPESKKPRPYAIVESRDQSRSIDNPVAVDDLVDLIAKDFRQARTALITGGEPLLQASSAIEIGRRLKKQGLAVHLETNGTIVVERQSLVEAFDFISMDIKLPSSQGGKEVWINHRKFMEQIDGHNTAVKIVVTPDAIEEAKQAIIFVSEFNSNIPVLIQPAHIDGKPSIDVNKLLDLCRFAQQALSDVRVSIQIHKVLGLR